MLKVAIIPARSGSKRILKKNIKTFHSKPIIYWSIKIAKESGIFDKIIVSTDSNEIKKIVEEYNVEVPFLRPSSLSDDYTPTNSVILHSLDYLNSVNYFPDYACCIYPCAPLMLSDDIVKAFNMMVEKNFEFIYPITKYNHPIQRALRINKDSSLAFINPEHELRRTQDLDTSYHDAAQFYWGKSSSWSSGKNMHSCGSGMIIPSWRVSDIDDDNDWKRSEILFKVLNKEIN